MCELGILVCLPLRRSNNLDLPLAPSMAGNSSSSLSLVGKLGCLPVEKGLRVLHWGWTHGGGDVVQLGLCIVHRGDRADGGGDVR